eukprot:SAG25_NODE_1292_length_3385_cov_25.883445_4_plen_174_part_01
MVGRAAAVALLALVLLLARPPPIAPTSQPQPPAANDAPSPTCDGVCARGAHTPTELSVYGRGGRAERLGRAECVQRGLCSYAGQGRIVEQYSDPAACKPPAPSGRTCCEASGGEWFAYVWKAGPEACPSASIGGGDGGDDDSRRVAAVEARNTSVQPEQELTTEAAGLLVGGAA